MPIWKSGAVLCKKKCLYEKVVQFWVLPCTTRWGNTYELVAEIKKVVVIDRANLVTTPDEDKLLKLLVEALEQLKDNLGREYWNKVYYYIHNKFCVCVPSYSCSTVCSVTSSSSVSPLVSVFPVVFYFFTYLL